MTTSSVPISGRKCSSFEQLTVLSYRLARAVREAKLFFKHTAFSRTVKLFQHSEASLPVNSFFRHSSVAKKTQMINNK